MKGIYVPVGIMRISVIFPDICLYSLYFSLRHVISEGNTMLRILLEVCRFLWYKIIDDLFSILEC